MQIVTKGSPLFPSPTAGSNSNLGRSNLGGTIKPRIQHLCHDDRSNLDNTKELAQGNKAAPVCRPLHVVIPTPFSACKCATNKGRGKKVPSNPALYTVDYFFFFFFLLNLDIYTWLTRLLWNYSKSCRCGLESIVSNGPYYCGLLGCRGGFQPG